MLSERKRINQRFYQQEYNNKKPFKYTVDQMLQQNSQSESSKKPQRGKKRLTYIDSDQESLMVDQIQENSQNKPKNIISQSYLESFEQPNYSCENKRKISCKNNEKTERKLKSTKTHLIEKTKNPLLPSKKLKSKRNVQNESVRDQNVLKIVKLKSFRDFQVHESSEQLSSFIFDQENSSIDTKVTSEILAKFTAFCLVNFYGKHTLLLIESQSPEFTEKRWAQIELQKFARSETLRQKLQISQEKRLINLLESIVNPISFEEEVSVLNDLFDLTIEKCNTIATILSMAKIFQKITRKQSSLQSNEIKFHEQIQELIKFGLQEILLNNQEILISENLILDENFFKKKSVEVYQLGKEIVVRDYLAVITLIDDFKINYFPFKPKKEHHQKPANLPVIEQGFEKLNKIEFEENLKDFKLILQDKFYQLETYTKDGYQYDYKVYKRSFNWWQDPSKIEDITLKYFKFYTLNMDFLPSSIDKDYQRFYSGADIEKRAHDIVAQIKKAFDQGFNFICIQQICHKQARQILKRALQNKTLKCYCPTFYWKNEKQQPYNTLILSSFPVKFGEIKMKLSAKNKKNQLYSNDVTRMFCEFKIQVDEGIKTVRILSAHLKANHTTKRNPMQFPHVRQQQIRIMNRFGQNCQMLFIMGDLNIGTRAQYALENQFIDKFFVDFLHLKCNILKLQQDKQGRIFGTYLWRQDGESGQYLSCERMDRHLVKIKGLSLKEVKQQMYAHVQVYDAKLSCCKVKMLDRYEIYKENKFQDCYIHISDHSTVKSAFGFGKSQSQRY